jgi:hypothetical protein
MILLTLTEKATAQFQAKVQAARDDMIEEKARFATDEKTQHLVPKQHSGKLQLLGNYKQWRKMMFGI